MAPAAPPPLALLRAQRAGTPRDPAAGVKELWAAYPLKHERPKAKAEYQKLNPDGTLHAEMVRAASAWASAYEDNGTYLRWRKKLHTWISGENWDADPPLPYELPKAAAIATKRAGKTKAKAPAADTQKPYTRRAHPEAKAEHPAGAGRMPSSRAAPPKVRAKPSKPYTADLRPVKQGRPSPTRRNGSASRLPAVC